MANNPDASSAADLEAGTKCSSKFFGNFRRFRLTKPTTQQEALLLLGAAAAFIDPLFFYIPMIDEASKCFKSDRNLGIFAISLRSLGDMLYVLRSSYDENKPEATAAASSATAEEHNQVSRPPLRCPLRISKANRRTFIDILRVLPLPQATTLAILIIKGDPRSVHAVTLLKFSVLIQFVLRVFKVFSFNEALTYLLARIKRHFWIGAGYNLALFVIASNMLGAFWYLLSVGRMMDCWKSACRSRVGCCYQKNGGRRNSDDSNDHREINRKKTEKMSLL